MRSCSPPHAPIHRHESGRRRPRPARCHARSDAFIGHVPAHASRSIASARRSGLTPPFPKPPPSPPRGDAGVFFHDRAFAIDLDPLHPPRVSR